MKKWIFTAGILFYMLLSVSALGEVTIGGKDFSEDTEYIDLGEMTIEFDDIQALLHDLPNVKQIDMFGVTLEGKQMDKLKDEFPDVKVNCVIHLAAKHYIRTDAKVFSTLHGSCSMHSSKELAPLRYCTELMALDIGHNDLTDISFISELKHLRVLILACNENLINIRPLSELKELEYLELFSTNIQRIDSLAGLNNLLDLNLSNTKINTLNPVLGLKKLMRLWAPQCDGFQGKAGMEKLQAALPGATIMTHGHPTDHGWRIDDNGVEHPHYSIIYRMFRGEDYIPFAESAPLLETEEN